jgi:hypothetical protein
MPSARAMSRSMLAVRGKMSATNPRTPRLIAYSKRRACSAVPTPAPCHLGETLKATSARLVVGFKKIAGAADHLVVLAWTRYSQERDAVEQSL